MFNLIVSVMVTTKDIKRTAVNCVAARKCTNDETTLLYVIEVNGAMLTGATSWGEANSIAYGACLMLRSLGYETRIAFANYEQS